jgi:hypothetical protein
MPRPCRFLLFSLAAVLVGLAIGVWLLWPTASDHINHNSYQKIQEGMSLAQVEHLLGGPPGHYNTRPIGPLITEVTMPVGATLQEWVGNDWRISVCLSADASVLFAEIDPVPIRAESVVDRLRRWLRL